MFVQDFQLIERSYPQVAAELQMNAASVLINAVAPASDASQHLAARVSPVSRQSLLTRTAEIRLGPIRSHGDGLIVAFSWNTPDVSAVFAHLDADLEVAPFGQDRTEATLRGSYEPPGGILGKRADQAIFHRIAEGTVRLFLAEVCRTLEFDGQPFREEGR
jgi:hypothetical protein